MRSANAPLFPNWLAPNSRCCFSLCPSLFLLFIPHTLSFLVLPPIVRPIGPSRSPRPKKPLLVFFFVAVDEEEFSDELACDVAAVASPSAAAAPSTAKPSGRSSTTTTAVVETTLLPLLASELLPSPPLAEARAGQKARRRRFLSLDVDGIAVAVVVVRHDATPEQRPANAAGEQEAAARDSIAGLRVRLERRSIPQRERERERERERKFRSLFSSIKKL